MFLPQARQDGLTIRELPEEVLIYDLERNKAHSLNRAAALVWRHCDGRTGVAALAALLHRELGVPQEEEIVRLALEQLGRRRLLTEAPPESAPAARHSRREMLRKLGKIAVVAAAVPVIMTLAAPKASAAASVATGGNVLPFTTLTFCKTDADCKVVGSSGTRCINGQCQP